MNFHLTASVRRILGCIVLMFSVYFTGTIPAISGQTTITIRTTSQFAGTWAGQWAEMLTQKISGVAALQSGRVALKISPDGTVLGALRNDTSNVAGTLTGHINDQGVMVFKYAYANSATIYMARCVLSAPDGGQSSGAMNCFQDTQTLSTGKIAIAKATVGANKAPVTPSTGTPGVGATRPLSIRTIPCRMCMESGSMQCNVCGGTGTTPAINPFCDDKELNTPRRCWKCNGSTKMPCPYCGGARELKVINGVIQYKGRYPAFR